VNVYKIWKPRNSTVNDPANLRESKDQCDRAEHRVRESLQVMLKAKLAKSRER